MSKLTGNEDNGSYEVEYEDRAVLVLDDAGDVAESEANADELRLLTESAGVRIVDEMRISRSHPDPAFYIGHGNSDELYIRIQESGANVALIGVDLTPTQQRNIGKVVQTRVVDRTQLILDIFAARARTNEGKLQVELAQLKYLLPRLSGRGVEMSRIGGGSGGIANRGPGETKLETDRRRVRDRINLLNDNLDQVVKQRALQNQARRKLMIPNAALVGYTSAGKSTLINKLTGSDIMTDAMLFATLDPTTRRVENEGCSSFLLSDTVGFISKLPHNLVAAFRATLEEVVEADFLIHVVDASHPHVERQVSSVVDVLMELGVSDKPTITVYNKCDIVKDQYTLRSKVAFTPDSCYISALTGDGLDNLIMLCGQVIENLMKMITAVIPYANGDILAMCHDRGRVIDEEYLDNGVRVTVELAPDLASKLDRFVVDKTKE